MAPQKSIISIISNSGNVTDSYNNCNISVADGKRVILEWLSPDEPRERHQTIGRDRVAGVGDWILHTNEFTQWNRSNDGTANPVLFCYGDPGVGKTYLNSLVIDRLCDQVDVDNMAVACVYCDFHAQNEQSATGLLGVLLKQVVSALEPIPDEVQRSFESSKGRVGGRRLLLPDILEMLTKSLSRLRRVFICIDALDEFPAKYRPELWECLQQIVQKCPATRLFLTGRFHIRDEVQRYFPGSAQMLPISPKERDIGLYLRMRLRRDPEPGAMDEELEADILRIIPKAISGIFLLVSLNMDAILAEATIHQRRQALHRMTKGLGLQDAYNTTLDRIRQQGGSKPRLGMEALMWISHSERPLRSEELCHALGVELGAEDFNTHNVPSIQTVLGCTLGLVTIDKTVSTIRLLHFTLQEYLAGNPTLFVTAHSMMAEVCLTYLNFRSVQALPLHLSEALATAPFLEYATCSWGTHAARGVTEPVKSLALRLLDGYENHVSAAVLWRMIGRWHWVESVREISGLHCIAFWGIGEIAITMLEMKRWQANVSDSRGETPLMWAVEYGNNRMVELFLKQEDIEPDKVIRDGRTVFSIAAGSGKKDAVRILLERGDVNPDSLDINGRTPLSLAATGGHEGVVKLLLERADVNPNSSDNDGRTPLSYCAPGIGQWRRGIDYSLFHSAGLLSQLLVPGHEGVMKLLLERGDVNPNSPDSNGRTPLSFAAEQGVQNAVKLLLEREDVDPNLADSNGRTPLLYAATSKAWDVVKLLLERGDVSANSANNDGRTLLSFAAEAGEPSVVKLLLECHNINPNSSDNDGRTPLLYCAHTIARLPHRQSRRLRPHSLPRPYKDVMKLLLEHGDVDPNLADSNGRTPLSFAAESGRKHIVKLVLERGDVYPDSPDSNGRTPLLYAAASRAWDVVKLLLERGDVSANSADSNNQTPLSFAARVGELSIVKLLLERGGVDPNSPDSNGRTPLLYAAASRAWDVVKLLLKRRGIHPNSADSNGRTPLSFAAEVGELSIVKLLLERHNVDPNSPDNDGRTPLLYCAGTIALASRRVVPSSFHRRSRKSRRYTPPASCEGVMKLLLQRRDVDPNSADSNGRTPLSFAAERGREHLVKLLLERGDVNPDSPDSNGRTPLLYAATWRAWDVMELLLQRGDVDPNSLDIGGRTPLSFAAEEGELSVVKLLLKRGGVDPNSPDSNGRTPLSYAIMKGREDVVSLLLGSGTPNCESLENRDRMSTSVTEENASHKQATHPLTATEPVTPYTADDPPPGAPAPGSWPPLEQPPPLERSSPGRPHPPLVPPIPIPPTLGFSPAFPFFFWILIPFVWLFFALMIYYGCGDSLELFHAIRPTWQ